MANTLKTGLAYLTTYFKQNESEIVTYARGYDAVDISAFLGGDQLLKLDDGMGGFRIEHTDLDVFIPNDDDFTFGDGRIVPQRGDIIYVTRGGDVLQFEVFPFGNTEPTHRLVHLGTMYRIHTKHIDTEQFYS